MRVALAIVVFALLLVLSMAGPNRGSSGDDDNSASSKSGDEKSASGKSGDEKSASSESSEDSGDSSSSDSDEPTIRILANTTIQEHPHVVSVPYRGRPSCSGVVIGDFHVLTAAHCVQESKFNYAVQTNNGNRFQSVTTYNILSITSHPGYNDLGQGTYLNDLAVLEVSARLTDTLPPQQIVLATAADGDFARRQCTITGWGESVQLQETSAEVLTNRKCSMSWGSDYNQDANVCIDACIGDAGGSLVCGNALVGLNSWGVPNCVPSDQSVYVRVSNYNDWIIGAMA